MSSIILLLIDFPSNAPSKSTTCIFLNPRVENSAACSNGDFLYSVILLKSTDAIELEKQLETYYQSILSEYDDYIYEEV